MDDRILKDCRISAEEQLRRNRSLSDFSKIQSIFRSAAPVKWLFAGDSITHGCLHTREYPRFSEIFEFYLGANPKRRKDMVFNTGVSGATTAECLNYENEWLYSLDADVVFICFGMNDAVNPEVTPQIFEDNLRRFIEKLREQGAVPVLQTPQLSGRKRHTDLYNEITRQVADEEQTLLVDLDKFCKNHRKIVRGMLNDPIHPNRYGHLLWARLLIKAVGLPEVSEVFTLPRKKLKGSARPYSETGKAVFSEKGLRELTEEKRVTRILLIGDFDTDCSFPKRTVPEHFEEIIRFKMADSHRTSLMRFCFHIDTSRVSCGEILRNYDFYMNCASFDALVIYSFEDADKEKLEERIAKDFAFTIKI